MRPFGSRLRWPSPAFLLTAAAGVWLGGCKVPDVNVTTTDPLKVDINMRIDVYQNEGGEKERQVKEDKDYKEVAERQRKRVQEVQMIKDYGLVGEDHRGLLAIRKDPGEEWGAYLRKTVSAENEDRLTLMRRVAKDGDRLMNDVQKEFWETKQRNAYDGEWVEMPGDRDGSYKWAQVQNHQKSASPHSGKALPATPPVLKAPATPEKSKAAGKPDAKPPA